MQFHHSRLGSFGGGIPMDQDGYITCNQAKVDALYKAIVNGRDLPRWALSGNEIDTNLLVAQATVSIYEWRGGKSRRAED